jgi:hypothetical protein
MRIRRPACDLRIEWITRDVLGSPLKGAHAMKWRALFSLLGLLALTAIASAQGTAAQRDACEDDAFRWCAYDIPDVDAIQACLWRNVRWISPACQAQMGYRPRRR